MRKTARAILLKDDQILLMDRNKFGRKYRALVGGKIEIGETPEQALRREVLEEASITFKNERLVIVEDAGSVYGMQYIYLCEYDQGEASLDIDSEEYKISSLGKNLYKPIWFPTKDILNANILPKELNQLLDDFFKLGFPQDQPYQLKINT